MNELLLYGSVIPVFVIILVGLRFAYLADLRESKKQAELIGLLEERKGDSLSTSTIEYAISNLVNRRWRSYYVIMIGICSIVAHILLIQLSVNEYSTIYFSYVVLCLIFEGILVFINFRLEHRTDRSNEESVVDIE